VLLEVVAAITVELLLGAALDLRTLKLAELLLNN
jgi:hypothetical protein